MTAYARQHRHRQQIIHPRRLRAHSHRDSTQLLRTDMHSALHTISTPFFTLPQDVIFIFIPIYFGHTCFFSFGCWLLVFRCVDVLDHASRQFRCAYVFCNVFCNVFFFVWRKRTTPERICKENVEENAMNHLGMKTLSISS